MSSPATTAAAAALMGVGGAHVSTPKSKPRKISTPASQNEAAKAAKRKKKEAEEAADQEAAQLLRAGDKLLGKAVKASESGSRSARKQSKAERDARKHAATGPRAIAKKQASKKQVSITLLENQISPHGPSQPPKIKKKKSERPAEDTETGAPPAADEPPAQESTNKGKVSTTPPRACMHAHPASPPHTCATHNPAPRHRSRATRLRSKLIESLTYEHAYHASFSGASNEATHLEGVPPAWVLGRVTPTGSPPTCGPLLPNAQGAIKLSIKKEDQRSLGFLFKEEAIGASFLSKLPEDTYVKFPLNTWAVKSLKNSMTGPFIILHPSELEEEASKIHSIYVRPSHQFQDGKAVALADDATPIKFSAAPARDSELSQVTAGKAAKQSGSWLVVTVSAEAAKQGGSCKAGVQFALRAAGFKVKAAWQTAKFGVHKTSLHCKIYNVPTDFDFTEPFWFEIRSPSIKRHQGHITAMASELLTHLNIKKCCYGPADAACLCHIARDPQGRAPVYKGRSKRPSQNDYSNFIAEQRAMQQIEEGKLTYSYTPLYSYRWDHTLGYEGEGPNSISLVSLNVNGIMSNNSWPKLLDLARLLKVDILCLQETNLSQGDPRVASLTNTSEFYGFKPHFGYSPAGGGTAILINSSTDELKVTYAKSALQGRVTYLDLTCFGKKLRIMSCYAPATGSQRARFMTKLRKFATADSILAGDWNCVLDPALDLKRTSTNAYENNGAIELQKIVDDLQLNDEIRIGLGLDFEFTKKSTSHNGYSLTRIDRIYTPTIPDVTYTSDIDHTTWAHLADHSATTLHLADSRSENTVPTKRELITLNEEAIYETELRRKIGIEITKCQQRIDQGKDLFKSYNKMKKSILYHWKRATKKIASEISKDIKEKELILKTLLDSIKIAPTKRDVQQSKRIQRSISDLKLKLHPPKPKSSKFMFNKEERMSREFFKDIQPKSKGASKIDALEKVNDWHTPPPKNTAASETTEDVAQAASKYFENLALPYTPHSPAHATEIADAQQKLLSELEKWGVEERTSSEIGQDITTDEIEKISATVPIGKSPGPDRLPNILYRAFAKPLAPILAAVYNKARASGAMPKGFNDGIVTILYKKGVRTDVRNYRPITLLNNDYKILTRILAKRMLRIITQCISDNQIGFMPRTFLAESTMLVKLIQAHLDNIDEGGLLVFLDLEKAFDRVSWGFMKEAMKALRFTDNIQKWIGVLYDETAPPKRMVYANGKLSKPYNISLGVAQGCPLSPILFTIVIEGFTRLVKNSKLNGVNIGPHKFLISHFADDTFGILKDHKELPLWDQLCNTFYTATNMKENLSKRELLPVGSLQNIDPLTLPGVTWDDKLQKNTNPTVVTPGNWLRSLGYPIGNNFDATSFLNTIYTKAKKALVTVQHISSRTPDGKHKVLNACFYGRFRFYLWGLEFPNELNEHIRSDAKLFLWKKSPDLQADQMGSTGNIGKFLSKQSSPRPWKKGGAGILDWEIHHKAFYAQWILKLFSTRKALWADIVDYWLGQSRHILIGKLSKSEKTEILNRIPQQATYLRRCITEFWKLQVSPKLDFEHLALQDKSFFEAQPIFRSHLITISKRYEKALQGMGITTFGDLFDHGAGQFMTTADFKNIARNNRQSMAASLDLRHVSASRINSAAAACTKAVNAIPDAIANMMISGDSAVKDNEIVAFTETYADGTTENLYGYYRSNKLDTLRVDSSGYYEPVGTPYDTTTWDINRECAKVAMQRKLILGVKNTTFPQNEGWTMKGMDDDQKPLKLSDLTIHRITTTLQQLKTSPPNCQNNWIKYLPNGLTIDWPKIWKSIGTPLTNPKDENVWLVGILHRHLYLRSKQTTVSQRCRLCGYVKESISHIVQYCRKITAVKSKICRMLRAMGTSTSDIKGIQTWVFGLNTDKKLLPSPCRALIRIMWRTIYIHMTKQEAELKKFHVPSVVKEIYRRFMARILAYQKRRHEFYVLRVNTKLPCKLPNSAAKEISPVGDLDCDNGALTIKKDIQKIMKQNKVWYDYTPHHQPTPPKGLRKKKKKKKKKKP